MKVLISITLLLFELIIISAHVVPTKLENSQPKESLPRDVYEIIEGGNEKTSFSAPKHERPTLREIVYYHVIERPYGAVKLENPSEPLQIEMDDSMRAFTNGHGYQFADMDLNETESHESPNLDSEEVDDEEEEEKSTEDETEDIETTTLENTKKINDVTSATTEETLANEKREIKSESTTQLPKTTLPSEEKKLLQRKFLFDRLRERYNASFKKNTTPLQDPVTSTTEKEVTSTESVEINKTSESTTTTLNPGTRVKRDLNYEEIPLSPTLGPIDYSQYPGLGVISEQEYGNGNRDLNRGMRFKINDIFATMKPLVDNVETEAYTPDSKVKTYGVNLTGDQGNVWNNMWRPINYHVGEPIKVYEVNEYEVSTVTPNPVEIVTEPEKIEEDTDIYVESTSARNKDIYVDTKKKGKGKGRALAFPEDTDDDLKDTTPKHFEDIYVESSSASYRDIYVDTKKGKDKRKPSAEKVEDIETDKNDEGLDSKDEKEETLEASTLKPLIHKKPARKERPHKDAKSDLYEQLINSDKFWKWLAHWTSNYMEVLSRNIKDIVKKEVAKEMEQYKNKNDNKPEITKNKEPIIKNNTLIIDDKKIPITNTSNLDANIDKDFLKKHRDGDKKPNHNKLNETKVENNKTDNNKITPNVTKNEENHNDVNAHNIYGSSTGNDHVTNVFIFYPGTETEKIMESLKPFIDTSISGSTIKDKKDKDNKQEDKITENPKETNKIPDNVTTPTPELNDKTTKASTTLPLAEKSTEKPESTNNKATVNVTEDSKPTTVVDSTEKNTEKSQVSTEASSKKPTSEIEKVENTKEELEATTALPSTEMSTEKSIVSTESSSEATTTESTSNDKITIKKDDSSSASSVQTSTGESTKKPIDSTESTTTIASSEKP